MRWCGPEVEVEGIISLKTGGCPGDCHFCSQSGLFASPVRSAWLDVPSLVEAAKQTAKSGATEFCIVAAVRGPDERLLAQVAAGIEAIRNEVDIHIACSLGMLSQEQVDRLAGMGAPLQPQSRDFALVLPQRGHHAHLGGTLGTLQMVRDAGMEVCSGGILGMGETLEQRAEFAANLAELDPHEVPLNFLNPRQARPSATSTCCRASEALRAVAAFRLALRTMLRFAGGREITLGDLGAKKAFWAVSTPSSSATTSRHWPPCRGGIWSFSKTFRCRSRHSTPACRRWKMLEPTCARGRRHLGKRVHRCFEC